MNTKGPCRFFAKGMCNKGDACEFQHVMPGPPGMQGQGPRQPNPFNPQRNVPFVPINSGDSERGRGGRGRGRGGGFGMDRERFDDRDDSFQSPNRFSGNRGRGTGDFQNKDSYNQETGQFQDFRGRGRGGRGDRGDRGDRGRGRSDQNYNERRNYYDQQQENPQWNQPTYDTRGPKDPNIAPKNPSAIGKLNALSLNHYLKELNDQRNQARIGPLIVKEAIDIGSGIVLVIRDRTFFIYYDTATQTFFDTQKYISTECNDSILGMKTGAFSDFVNMNFTAIAYNKFNELNLRLRLAH